MVSMVVYYRAPNDPEAFERRYIEGHLPLVKGYERMRSYTFNKVTRSLVGEFPYAYAFVGIWDDKDGWKSDLSSDHATIATEDGKTFAPPFDVVVYETIA